MPGKDLERAIALVKSNQPEPARALLMEIVRKEPTNINAWLWLVEVMPDNEQRLAVLEACYKRNPKNSLVLRAMDRVRASMPPEDLDSFRDAMTGKTRSRPAAVGPVTVPEEGQPSGLTGEVQPELAEQPGAAPQAGLSQPRLSRRFRLALIFLGVLVLGVIVILGYQLRDQWGPIVGLPRAAGHPTQAGNPLGTAEALRLTALVTPSPQDLPATETPIPSQTLVPIPTIRLGYSFPNEVIAPENGAQVVQTKALAGLPALSVAISPDNRLVAAGLEDATVMLWNLASGDLLHTFHGHSLAVEALAFSPDGRYLVSGSDDFSVRIWNVVAGTLVDNLTGHSRAVKSVAFSPNGQNFASGGLDGTVFVWELGTATAKITLTAGPAVYSLAYSSDGSLLAAGLQTGSILVWNTADYSVVNTLPGSGGAANSLAFDPGGRKLAVGSADQSVKMYDVTSGRFLYTIGTHNSPVLSVSFSPNGQMLASASQDQTVKLWDVTGRREIASFQDTDNIVQIVFSPDGRALAGALSPTSSGSRTGGVGLWGIQLSTKITPSPNEITLDILNISRWLTGVRLAAPHAGHQSVAISGGRILIIGGGVAGDKSSYTDKVEIYNPATSQSSFSGSLNVPRGQFSATLLPDGRVLVVGGYNPTQGWLASAEIYDPLSGKWQLSDPLFNHGTGHTATLLPDGQVLVAGGCSGEDVAGHTNQAELFDPATGSWTETGSLNLPRCDASAVLLANGQVLVAGGEGGQGSLNSAELYNPATGRWSRTGNLLTARSQAAAVHLTDGRVMIIGGLAQRGNSQETLASVEIYDPEAGTWSQAEPLAHARYAHTATLLPGGQVLVVGGLASVEADTDQFLTSVELFIPYEGSWHPLADLSSRRAFHTTLLTPDGHIYVIGGLRAMGAVLATTEILTEIKPIIINTRVPTIAISTTPTSTLPVELVPELTLTPTPTETPTGGGAAYRPPQATEIVAIYERRQANGVAYP